jgi:hypothetical protein
MDGGDDAFRVFPLLAYCCIPFQPPLVYATNQSEDFYGIITANILANRMTRRQKGNIGKCTGGGNNSLRERWMVGLDPWDIFP